MLSGGVLSAYVAHVLDANAHQILSCPLRIDAIRTNASYRARADALGD